MSGAPASTNAESNLLGLDYRAEAERLGPPVTPIIDVHTHVHGEVAPEIYDEVRRLFGVTRTYTMTTFESLPALRRVLGDSIRLIAMPRFTAPDRLHAMTRGFTEDLARWHAEGARMCKFWTAPRIIDIAASLGDPSLLRLDGAVRREQMDRAAELGMMFMAHIADPDTWFATRYKEASVYGTKASHYDALERMLEAYRVPWIVAHMGGWPENLSFLSGLLDRHANLHLDTSATKWMVRELSKHPRADVLAFFERHSGRLLFGSDIVTLDDHVSSAKVSPMAAGEKARQASSRAEAFDLYASRYFALRTMWETNHDAPAPFADGDLKMVDPARFDDRSSARLRGVALPPGLLQRLYRDNAERLVEAWWDRG